MAFDSPQVTALSGNDIAGLAWWDGAQYQVDEFSEAAINAGDGGRRGFWVFANSATSFGYTGTGGPVTSLVLHPGWNLVSLAGTGQVAGNALTTRVSGNLVPLNSVVFTVFSQLNQGGATPVDVQNGGTLLGGRAYWCYSTATVTLGWTLSPPPSPQPSAAASPTPTPAPTTPYLRFVAQPPQVVAGAAFSPAVEVVSPAGVRLPKFTGTVTLFPSRSVNGTLSRPLVDGVANFTGLNVTQAGPLTLTAAIPAQSMSVQGLPINIVPAAISQLLWLSQPGNTTAGVGFTPPVMLVFADQFYNAAIPNPPINVTIASNKHETTLVNKTATTNATTGLAVFSGLQQTVADSGYTLTATGQALSSTPSGSFSVLAASGSTLTFASPPPGNLTAGTPTNFRVEVRDSFGNLDTSSTNTIRLSIGTAPVTPHEPDLDVATSGNQTFLDVVPSGGIATFPVNPNNAGAWEVQVSSPGFGTPLPANFTVGASADLKLVYAQQPLAGVAGVSISPTVKVQFRDVYDNPLVPASPVTVTIYPAGLEGNVADTDPVTGVASFPNLKYSLQSNYQLTAIATLGSTYAVDSDVFYVAAASASRLKMYEGNPTSITVGSYAGFYVECLDEFSNHDFNATNGVGLYWWNAPSGPNAQPDLDIQQAGTQGALYTSASSGWAFFPLAPNNAGTWQIGAFGFAGETFVEPFGSFNLLHGSPAYTRFWQGPPSVAVAGAAFGSSVIVEVLDVANNRCTTWVGDGSIYLLTGTGNGFLLGYYLYAPFSAGLATFSGVTVNNAHWIGQLYSYAVGTGASGSYSNTFVISPELASRGDGFPGAPSTANSTLTTTGGRGMSSNSRYSVFVTNGIPVPGNGTVSAKQVWRRDRFSGVTTLASGDGTAYSTTDCFNPSISADGRWVSFSSAGLYGASVRQIWLKDMWSTPGLYLASSTNGTHNFFANGACDFSAVSSTTDGNGALTSLYVAFRSSGSNLLTTQTGASQQIWRKNLFTNATELVSRRNGQGAGDGSSTFTYSLDMTPDGRYVSFFAGSNTNLVDSAGTSFHQIYRRDMNPGGTVQLVSRMAGGTATQPGNWHADNTPCRISADGRYVIYLSEASNLCSPNRTGHAVQIWRRDMNDASGASELMSRKAGGAAHEGGNNASSHAEISADGMVAAYISAATDLVAGGTNQPAGKFAVFRRRVVANATNELLSKNVSGGAISNEDCAYPSLSSDGTTCLFETNSSTLGLSLGGFVQTIIASLPFP